MEKEFTVQQIMQQKGGIKMCGQAENQQKQRHTLQTSMTMPQQEMMQPERVLMRANSMHAQTYRRGSRMAERIRSQAEAAQAEAPMGDVPQQRQQERAALSKAEKKTLRRQQREQERQRRRQAEEQRRQEELRIQREREEAEAQRQEELRRRAEEMTQASSVTRGVSPEDWARHGGASYHYTLRTEEAQRIVEASNGCIYAKPVAEGLVELRATLPEKVKIDGREIHFRRSYNLMMKVIAGNILDENGKVLDGAQEFANKLSEGMSTDNLDELSASMRDLLFPGIRKLYSSKSKAEGAYKEVSAMIRGMNYGSQCHGLPREILNAFCGFVGDLNGMDATHFIGQKKRLQQQLQKEVDLGAMSPEEMRQALDVLSVPELLERKNRMQKAMQEDGYSEEEQQQMLKNVTSMYADLDSAKLEFMRMREMDINSKEVFLPNACSANGAFFKALHKLRTGQEQDFVLYDTHEHFYAYRMEHVNYALHHVPKEHQEDVKRLEDVKSKLERNEKLTRGEEGLILRYSKPNWKYEYHVAANIGQVDDMQLTIEEFAAETVQYAVSPFSTESAIGLYRGNAHRDDLRGAPRLVSDGMIAYYNHDNPMPSDEAMPLANTKITMLKQALPGDEFYVSRKKEQKGEKKA